MFNKDVYIERRKRLKEDLKSGLILFLGNEESPMNYADNIYPFRQDSSFLYFWGLDSPGLAGVIDIDENEEIVYGYDFTVDDIVWMEPQETLAEKAKKTGALYSEPLEKLDKKLKEAVQKGRKIHYLPQYRADNILKIEHLLGIESSRVNDLASMELTKVVISQRSIKSAEEVEEIEKALDISYEMNAKAMEMTRPGIYEREVSGIVEGLVLSKGSRIAFPIIFSIHGETLHNHSHANLMQAGDILVLDSGAESPLHYASDITRTFPVSGKFSGIQKDIYNVVLSAQEKAIEMVHPGIRYKDIHLDASRVMAEGLKELGFMKGNVDDAVSAGAHALFFPHGLGHMLGLDVHDMENLGEDLVGYDSETKRSAQFGLAYLRLGKKLEPGFVLTVEPGIYFIPQLIDQWKAENKFKDFIDYDNVEKHKDFGGIRIEDDVLVTETDHRVLGKRIAKTVEEIE
ncbi:MAG: aminopeptidase P family protein, partial [Candidatus Neomarinimicrobiota bacterium]